VRQKARGQQKKAARGRAYAADVLGSRVGLALDVALTVDKVALVKVLHEGQELVGVPLVVGERRRAIVLLPSRPVDGIVGDWRKVALERKCFVGDEARARHGEGDREVAGEVLAGELEHDVVGDRVGGDVAVLTLPEVGDIVDLTCRGCA
jgi:hypothetical protein